MARIRSVHPSLFTDEAWVSCTPLARLLYIGLWTDADDQGLFEWKPLQLKMRLLPGDDADVTSLLTELVEVNLIACLESGGKKLGAIRYFRRFQRPKKPNKTFLLPSEWVNYVGLGDASSEPPGDDDRVVRNQCPTEGENSPQMEDGGGRREEASVSNETGAEAPDRFLVELSELEPKTGAWRLAKHVLVERGGLKTAAAGNVVGGWMKGGAIKPETLWEVAEAAWRCGTEDPVAYMTAALREAGQRDADPMLSPEDWRQRRWMEEFREGKFQWATARGPAPGEPGCRVTAEIQREFGVEPAAPAVVRRAS